MDEDRVRVIAREESTKLFATLSKNINKNTKILSRLERLLLGEVGVNEEDTIKARANFAYLFAKQNTANQIVERLTPALKWFEDMDEIESGDKESKLDSLGKIISFYTGVKFLFGLIGFTTLVNSIPILVTVLKWLKTVI